MNEPGCNFREMGVKMGVKSSFDFSGYCFQYVQGGLYIFYPFATWFLPA
jgi:hypothetical protein